MNAFFRNLGHEEFIKFFEPKNDIEKLLFDRLIASIDENKRLTNENLELQRLLKESRSSTIYKIEAIGQVIKKLKEIHAIPECDCDD